MSNFSEILVSLRKRNNLTQQDLARKLGVSRSVVGMYETNQRMPSFEVLDAIAKIFDVSIDYLVGNTDHNDSLQIKKVRKSPLIWLDSTLIAADNAIYHFAQDVKEAFCNNRGGIGPIPEEIVAKNNQSVHIMTDSEKSMLDLFNQIPPNQQQVMLAMMRAYVESCRSKDNIEES